MRSSPSSRTSSTGTPGPSASSTSGSSTARILAPSSAGWSRTRRRRGAPRVILDPMAETELTVICKSCGSEVSPYVTECPYCGTRLRRRAPKLERRGDELTARETLRARRRRRAAERRARGPRLAFLTDRPYVTIAAILAPAVLVVVLRASDLIAYQVGAVLGAPGFTDPWWHYLVAPFVYEDIGYLFVIGLAMALCVPYLERRLGPVPALLLLLACGALGALAAPALDDAFGDGLTAAAGGNGLAVGALG